MTDVVTSPDGIAIRYNIAGSGTPALVFVHGWSCDRTYWADQMGALSTRHRVAAIDLAGHGESGDGRESWTMPRFGGDVTAVVGDLGVDELVLIGHSMGGDVIVEAALALGRRVRGLVWVDTYASLDSFPSADEVAAFVEPFRADFSTSTQQLVRRMFPSSADPELVNRVAIGMSSARPEIAIDVLLNAISNGQALVKRLPRLGVPIVALNPDYRPTDEESLRRHGVTPIMMSGVGHFLMMEDPDRFNGLLASVVQRFR
jgi:pimeloyl-ACP methyl ester carboxylesterase